MRTHEVGDIRTYRGQRYKCVAVDPHTRQDGDQTMLATFRSHCADCDMLFDFRTSQYYTDFQPNRRCGLHADPFKKVSARKKKFGQ